MEQITLRNHSIDILRCVFAFMVVYLHTHYWIGYPVDLCRCAVPGFMVMTGFFLYSENQEEVERKLLKSAKHHLVIYAWSLLLYVLLTIRDCYKNGDFSCFSCDGLNKFFIYAETDFLYFGFHLWYLHAVIYALLIIWGLSKIGKTAWLIWFVPLFLLANYELFKYLVSPIVCDYHLPTYITFGIPYLFIGMIMKKNEETVKTISKSTVLILLVFFCVSLFFEGQLFDVIGINANDKYVSTVFLVILLLIMCIAFPMSKESKMAEIGRKYSLDIYVFHNFMLFLYYTICNHLPSFLNDYVFKYASPIIIFFATLIFAVIFRYITQKTSAVYGKWR